MTEARKLQRVGAYGLAVSGGRVLLAQISKSTRGGVGQWMLPGGGVEHGEHPEATLVREFEEETGLSVAVGRLLEIESDQRIVPPHEGTHADVHTVMLVYSVTVVGGHPRGEVNGAMTAPSWVRITELDELPVFDAFRRILGRLLPLES